MAKERNFSTGSPFKLILGFSIPFLLINVFNQIYNLADSLIVGRTIGTDAMAAVSSTGNLMWLTFSVPCSLGLGFSMLTARYFGANDTHGVKKSFANALVITLILCFVLTVFCVVFLKEILMVFGFPKELFDYAYRYLFWIMLGIIPNTLYNFNANMMRALGESKTPMIFMILSCVINIVLDYVFIVFGGMGTDGAGLATCIAQTVSCVLSFILIRKSFPSLHAQKEHYKLEKATIKALLKLGVPIALFDMVNSSGAAISQYAVNSMGVNLVAAVAGASKLFMLLMSPIFAIGSAVGVYAAQNYGAGNIERIKRGTRDSCIMVSIWIAVSIVISLWLVKPVVRFIANTNNPTVLNGAFTYMVYICVFFIFLMLLNVYRTVLQACGDGFTPVLSSFIEFGARIFCTFVLTPLLGFTGVCLISPLAWVFSGLVNWIGYIRFCNKYKTEKYIKE